MTLTLTALLATVLLLTGAEGADLSDSITEDDVTFYQLDVGDLSQDVVFTITWEDSAHDLDLYMLDPEGYIVANSTNIEGTTEEIRHTPSMTGPYTVGVHAWAVWRSTTYTGTSSHPVTRLTRSFSGTVDQGGQEEWRVNVTTLARPIFVRVFWEAEADELNITLRTPSGDRLNEDGEFWGFQNALFFLVLPTELGEHSLWVRGLQVASDDGASYQATCNFPVERVKGPVPGEDDGAGIFYTGVLLMFVAMLAVAFVATALRGRRRSREGAFTVEEVLVVSADGRLMHGEARGGGTADADLMTGMLVAIQGFVREGLRSGAPLESIRYGQSELLLASGSRVVLVVRVTGDPDEGLKRDLEDTVRLMETRHGPDIEAWSGDVASTAWMGRYVHPLVAISTADAQVTEVA